MNKLKYLTFIILFIFLRARRAAKTVNWATAAQNGGKVKSLAEIQAEEARVEKERSCPQILSLSF